MTTLIIWGEVWDYTLHHVLPILAIVFIGNLIFLKPTMALLEWLIKVTHNIMGKIKSSSNK